MEVVRIFLLGQRRPLIGTGLSPVLQIPESRLFLSSPPDCQMPSLTILAPKIHDSLHDLAHQTPMRNCLSIVLYLASLTRTGLRLLALQVGQTMHQKL